MSVDAVAARAGVSKATIYRRFESKLELVTAAMYQVAEERKPTPDTGSLAGDLRALVYNLIEMTQHQTFGCNARMMVADGLRNPELGKVHEEYVQYRRAGTLTVFERAIARGELRGDTRPSGRSRRADGAGLLPPPREPHADRRRIRRAGDRRVPPRLRHLRNPPAPFRKR